MSAPWADFAGVLDILVKGNFGSSWKVQERNRTLERPKPQALTDPVKILSYDFRAEHSEVPTVGRTLMANGLVTGSCWLQGNSGDRTIFAFLDQLQTIADTWALTEEAASTLVFYGVEFSDIGYVGDALNPEYAFRDWQLSFLYLAPVSDQGVGILGGISSSTLQVHGPALARLDFVGVEAGAWRRVKAVPGEPTCRGMVSVGPDSGGNATIVLSDFVRIVGGHGFPVGLLYLSQTVPGAVSSKPDNGIERVVAEVLNSTDLIIINGPDEDLGGGA